MSQTPDATNAAPLKTTPLDALHRELGGKMVPFAGYDMPVQYPAGIVKEHLHTRAKASLFDVSHMGQVRLPGDAAVAALEALVPGDLQALKPMRMRYTMFTDDKAGILDDLMVTRVEDGLFVVVNAACKEADIAHMRAGLPKGVSVEYLDDRALLALQGPAAVDVMARLAGEAVRTMPFMSAADIAVGGFACFVTRSSPPAWAPAIRCGWRRASASTAMTSIRPPRRSRPDSSGPSRSGGAKPAVSPVLP